VIAAALVPSKTGISSFPARMTAQWCFAVIAGLKSLHSRVTGEQEARRLNGRSALSRSFPAGRWFPRGWRRGPRRAGAARAGSPFPYRAMYIA
jgi:hypothetical protein